MPANPDAVRVSGDWAYRAQTSGVLGTLQKFPITARENAILLDISIPKTVGGGRIWRGRGGSHAHVGLGMIQIVLFKRVGMVYKGARTACSRMGGRGRAPTFNH